MSSANSESFTSFPIWITFTYFSALIPVAKTCKTMLNSSSDSGHPCLVPDFRGNTFNFSPLPPTHFDVLFSFFVASLSGFGTKVMVFGIRPHRMHLAIYNPLQFSGRA